MAMLKATMASKPARITAITANRLAADMEFQASADPMAPPLSAPIIARTRAIMMAPMTMIEIIATMTLKRNTLKPRPMFSLKGCTILTLPAERASMRTKENTPRR